MSRKDRTSFEDPVNLLLRAIKKLHSLWLVWTYPFVSVGKRFSVHYSCDIRREIAGYIKIGDDVLIGRGGRVDVPEVLQRDEPVIILDDFCRMGPFITILAVNQIHIGRNVMFGPSVLVTDHDHAFEDVTVPIITQGITEGGRIRIEDDCWIGFGAAIVCSKGELVIGKHSVVAVNSVVTKSVPPYSVVAGHPARIVKQFDPTKGEWVLGAVAVPVAKS
jgi:acetyltransferase-like isoleucine patch superfamily enzyme